MGGSRPEMDYPEGYNHRCVYRHWWHTSPQSIRGHVYIIWILTWMVILYLFQLLSRNHYYTLTNSRFFLGLSAFAYLASREHLSHLDPRSSLALPIMSRPSTSSDRHQLLANSQFPPSTTTSRAPSVLSRTSSTATLVAKAPTSQSQPLTLTPSATSARRFTSSEAEYLSLLRAWVEEKQYISLGADLQGFYGRKTMDMYAAKEGPRGKKGGESDAGREGKDLDCNGRRRTVAGVETAREGPEERVERKRRMSVRGWLGRG